MLDTLVEMLYRHPSTCRAAGRDLSSAAGFALICGANARIGTTAASVATGLAGQPPITHAAQLLPGMWTWWVPESMPGVIFYAAVLAGSVLVAAMAKRVERQLRAL